MLAIVPRRIFESMGYPSVRSLCADGDSDRESVREWEKRWEDSEAGEWIHTGPRDTP